MKNIFLRFVFPVLAGLTVCASSPAPVDVLVVVDAPGEQTYHDVFSQTVQDWLAACRSANKTFRVIEPSADETNEIHQVREALSHQGASEQELWIILIGHGTFDGKEAKFNLAGPDVSATELADLAGRDEILRIHVRGVTLTPELDVAAIARITPGFSGADLANIVNEAALLAARREKAAVEMPDFDEAIERVMAGAERRNRVMNLHEKEIVAVHEAGHALLASL